MALPQRRLQRHPRPDSGTLAGCDTTDKGNRRADALDEQMEDLWRDVRWSVADILGRPRLFAELV